MQHPQEQPILLNHEHPTVARLIDLQGDQTDSTFANRWLSVSASTWLRIKSGKYGASDHSRVLQKIEGGLAALEDALASSTRLASGATLQLSSLRTSLAAVRRAFGQARDRLVVILAPTGGGKTTFARALCEVYAGRVLSVEATETWRSSYIAPIHCMGEAAKLQDLPDNSRKAESMLVAELRARPRIIVIDEGHYFGPASINLIKAILNQTQCTVVLLAIPSLWARMKRGAWEEAQQLRSRTCALVKNEQLLLADAKEFIINRLGPESAKALGDAGAKRLADVCSGFGLLDTAELICGEALAEAGDDTVTMEILETAIRNTNILRS